MFYDADSNLTEKNFLTLMFVLNAANGEIRLGENIDTLNKTVASSVSISLEIDDLLSLSYQGLVYFWDTDGQPLKNRDPNPADIVGLTLKGMAVLVNSANRFLDKVVTNYEIPDGVTASLIPYLDIVRVPAADRYVSTADNQELFNALANDLESIKNELVRDQNANELPIPVKTKRAIAAELDGLVGQIRAGFVRISDLTTRARPIVKNIADTCKDLGVIGATISAAAYGAYEAIEKILTAIF